MNIEDVVPSRSPMPDARWEMELVHWDIEPREVTEVDMLPPPPPLWPRVWPGL